MGQQKKKRNILERRRKIKAKKLEKNKQAAHAIH